MAVQFYLYFVAREVSERASETLKGEGYAVETRLGADNANWLAFASREMSHEEIDAAEERMFELANSLGGEYDGYERTA